MSTKKVHHLMTTTASPGRKVSSSGKQPSPQARATARRYATSWVSLLISDSSA